MGKASWEENIESLMAEIDPAVGLDQNYVYGYTDASLLSSFVYGPLASLTMEYYIAVFAEEKLVLLEVSMKGRLTGNYGEILYADIESLKVKRGFLQYLLTIKIAGEKKPLKLKCNHKMMNAERMGMGWHKENLESLASQGWAGLA